MIDPRELKNNPNLLDNFFDKKEKDPSLEGVPPEELFRRVGVSEGTVLEKIKALIDAGVEVRCPDGKQGMVQIVEKLKTDSKGMFSPESVFNMYINSYCTRYNVDKSKYL